MVAEGILEEHGHDLYSGLRETIDDILEEHGHALYSGLRDLRDSFSMQPDMLIVQLHMLVWIIQRSLILWKI